MTHKADTLRPFLRCAAVVLCSLALPLAVFALWDRALLAAPHIRTDGERFSAAGRANATACTLYAAEHVTKVPLGSNSVWDGGWTAGTMDGSALARARRTLRALHEAGLLCDDSYAAAHPLCEECLAKGVYTPTEEIHHMLPLSQGGTHDRENLKALCKACHARIHAERGDRWHNT